MRLERLFVAGFRSIRDPLEIVLEPNVTVVLGPNDHGKTNLLEAIRSLNPTNSFSQSGDLNWDSSSSADSLPSVRAIFILTAAEQEWLIAADSLARGELNRLREEALASEAPEQVEWSDYASSAREVAIVNAFRGDEAVDISDEPVPSEPIPPLDPAAAPTQLIVYRSGCDSPLMAVVPADNIPIVIRAFLERFIPFVDLISPSTSLSDSVTRQTIVEGKNDFMRGIFYYAGLDPNHVDELFDQNDETRMRLEIASKQLNETLRASWSQGSELTFQLDHDSQNSEIDLLIRDPSVTTRFVRASRRSSGFTHYFALKTILHARQRDHEASSHLLLFDEPGVFLHPSGQFDLLQVLETLSKESQIVYVTHSLFMINKTFPTRHRLLMKDKRGTNINGKPYSGRWQTVLNALGITLSGTILFANHIVLTEGDSDPIYLYALFQKAISAGMLNLDINPLAIMSTSESQHADVLIRLLFETSPVPKIAVLVDGDPGGKERLKHLQSLLSEHAVPSRSLSQGTSIEGHISMVKEVYVPAVAAYAGKLMVYSGKTKPDSAALEKKFKGSFDKSVESKTSPHGLSLWAANAAEEICGVRRPSKVGIAREYAAGLLELPISEFRLEKRTKSLLQWIADEAEVPCIADIEARILTSEE